MKTPSWAARATHVGIVVLTLGLLTTACADDGFFPSDGQLPLGTWGSDGAGVIATDSVTHVHVGCTFGDVLGRLQLDSDGRFAADGSYVLDAYPVAVGPSLPAHFSGRLRGRILTMAIAVNDTIADRTVALGPIEVTFGRTAEMGPCPICVVPRPRR